MKYSMLRGAHLNTASSLTYVQMVLLPVLTALFDHLAVYEFGSDLLGMIFQMLTQSKKKKHVFLKSILFYLKSTTFR